MLLSDWITAAAAVASAVVAFLLWRVTSKYTAETGAIARANDRMAAANEHLIEEMRVDREVLMNQQSIGSSQQLTEGLINAMRIAQRASDPWWRKKEYSQLRVEREYRRAWEVWKRVYWPHAPALRDDVLWEEARRFHEVLAAMGTQYRTMNQLAEIDKYEMPNPRDRFDWASGTLLEKLAAHQRHEPIGEPELPCDHKAMTFWALPPSTRAEDWVKLADPEYDASEIAYPLGGPSEEPPPDPSQDQGTASDS